MYLDYVSFWDMFFYFSFMKSEGLLKQWKIRCLAYLILELLAGMYLIIKTDYTATILIALNVWTYYTLTYCILYSYYKNLWLTNEKPRMKNKVKAVVCNFTKFENLNILFLTVLALTVILSILTFQFLMGTLQIQISFGSMIALHFLIIFMQWLATKPQAVYL